MITFTVPATETDLLDLETVKVELGVTGTASDDLLERRIKASSATIAKLCNRANFGAATVLETLYRTYTAGAIWLMHWPVTAIVSVSVDGEILDPSEYELEEGRALYRLCGQDRTPWCVARLLVTYQGGYDLPDATPDDLAQAAMTMVRSSWFGGRRDPAVKVEEVPDVMRTEYWVGAVGDAVGGVPDEVMAILQNYTNFSFG